MKVFIKNGRLSFADIFKAKTFEEGSAPKFSANIILSDDSVIVVNKKEVSIKKLIKLCDEAFMEKMGIKKLPKSGYDNWFINPANGEGTRKPYVNSETDEYYAGTDEDTYYISASKRVEDCKDGKLTVVNQLKKPVSAQDDEVYSGCYVNVVVDLYAYKSAKNKGVTGSLEGIQKLADGDRLGVTKIDAMEDFDEVEVDDSFGDEVEVEEGEKGEDFE